MSADHEQSQPAERADPWRLAQLTLGIPVFFALFLFLPAGTLVWVKGWLFVVVLLVIGTAAAIYLWRVNPEIYVARSRFRKGTKRWDAILLSFLSCAIIAVFVVAALDDGRFHWSLLPWWVVGLGYQLWIVGFGLGVWAQAVNKFFEPTVRIQMDRGHKVIDTGPYAIVRHPGYVAGILFFPGIALSLGSLWALIPAGTSIGLLVLRTQWEDQTLQAELPGYKEYTATVPFKLIPGVW